MEMLSVTFDQACREIGRRTAVAGLEDIGERMALMGKMAKIVGVYLAARAKEPPRGSGRQHFLVPNIWELRRHGDRMVDCPPFDCLVEEMISWLAGKFPLSENYTYAHWTDDSEDNAPIQVCNPGIDLCWDEACELFECPESICQEFGLMILPIYAVFFGQFVGEDRPSFWDPAAEWFGWDAELPWWLWLPDDLWATDNQRFYRLLEKAGLPKVADAFRMAWHDTGTFFLDLEHNHDSYYGSNDTVHELTVENIEKLTALWAEARPIYARGFEACHEAFEHPEMYKTILALLGRCIVPTKSCRGKMTAKELRAAAAEYKKQELEISQGNKEEDHATE